MAVQMATSSAQDFLNFDLGNGANPSSGKTPGVPSFEEALASVVKTEQGKQPATHSAHVPGNGVTKRSAPNLAAIRAHLAMAVTGGEIATEEIETSPTLPQIAYELDRYLKSLAAQNCEAHPDVEFPDMQNLFTEWKLHLPVEKTARFNPDTILFPPEMICVEAEKVEEKMETEENAEMPLPSFFAPELSGEVLLQSTISGENVQSSEEAILPEKETDELLPILPDLPEGPEQDGMIEGEGALPQLPVPDVVAQNGKTVSAETEVVPVETGSVVAQDEQTPEVLSATPTEGSEAVMIAEEAGTMSAKTENKNMKTTGEERSTDDAEAHPDDAQSLEELFERYRQDRESQSGREQDTSPFSKPDAQKDRRNASNAAAAKRPQGGEPVGTNQQREARASVSREAPLSFSAGMEFKEALEAPLPAQPASSTRTGIAYTLDRALAFSDGINTVLEFMRTDGTSEARIVVEPPALGHIDVSLRATSVGMEATFRVDNEHLKQMLQQQMDVLKSSLQLQGIHVSSLAVDIRNRDDQRGRETAYASGKRSRRVGGTDGLEEGMDEGASLVRLDLEKGLLHWVG